MGAYIKQRSYNMREKAARAHREQFNFDWGVAPPPEWHDHYCDLAFQWHETRIPFWVERGIFNLLVMEAGCKVLELCCGDGFNACHFYSIRASKVVSVDFDSAAIHHALRYNHAPNVQFTEADIRTQMPEGLFSNIIWDGSIEHFTPEEIDAVVATTKSRIAPGGVLSGYTLKELETGTKQLVHHEYEFKSKEDLKRFFVPHFKNVLVFETKYPSRHNFYFFASDDALPFDQNWKYGTRK